jgi:hypothetical protein
MPTILHDVLTTTELHEPKGVSTASANKAYVANGSGSGSWVTLNPYGGLRYNNIGTGTTFSSPTSYTLMNAATTVTTVKDFTHNSLGRLTYTGTPNRHLHGVMEMAFKHSTGSGQDIYTAIYKNGAILGTPNTEIVQSADSGTFHTVAMHFDVVAATNDYFEVYLKTASGNVIVHSAYMFAMGMPG